MEENFQQKIEERLAELPPQVQEAIASSDFEERIRTICRAHNLHVDQMQAVADETTLAMLGFIDLDSLSAGLQERAHLSKEQAQTVADAIAHEVFTPIRESMKKWAEERAKPHQAAPTAPAAIATPAQTSSVMMPSSTPKPVVPAAGAPVAPANVAPTPVFTPSAPASPAPKPVTAAVSAPKPVTTPNLGAADAILSEKKVTPPVAAPTPAPAAPAISATAPVTAPAAPAVTPAASSAPKTDPAQPQPYKADPYREPVE